VAAVTRNASRPLLPHEELAAQAAIPKPQYRERAEPIDTSELPHRKMHPLRNARFLKSLTFKPCSIEGKTNQRTLSPHVCWSPGDKRGGRFISDPAHTGKAISGRKKQHDSGAFPLCRHAHNEQEDNMDRFDRDYEIDRHEIAAELYEQFLKEIAR
jgi:hypothetical protein